MIDFPEFYEKLTKSAKINLKNTEINEEKAQRLFTLCAFLIERNEYLNLTAITDIDGVITKHIIDCIASVPYIKQGARLIDIGCGGGFPTLPLAIMRDDLKITALDSTAKKLDFVSVCANLCGVSNVETLNMRAEDASALPEYREQYDIAISRAVARLNILSELCIPFVKVGGIFLAMKGNQAKEEFEEARNAIFKLGASKARLDAYNITFGNETLERGIVTAVKTTPTAAKFPRTFAKIKKSPL